MKLSDLPHSVLRDPRFKVMTNLRTFTDGVLELTIPVRTVNEVNDHKHWRVRQQRAKSQRLQTHEHLRRFPSLPKLPAVVTMTRLAPKKIDSDSLPCCFKHIRDEIAAVYGVDDGGDSIRWEYFQLPGTVKGYAVKIRIEQA